MLIISSGDIVSNFIVYLLIFPVYLFPVLAVYNVIRKRTAAVLCMSFVSGQAVYVFTVDAAAACLVTSLLCFVSFAVVLVFLKIRDVSLDKTEAKQIIVVCSQNDCFVYSDGVKLYRAAGGNKQCYKAGQVQNVSFDLFG